MVNVIRNQIDVHGKIKGMGYLKSLNSHRDYSIGNVEVARMLEAVNLIPKAKALKVKALPPPRKVDFRELMSPVRDQQSLGSCTAFAASAVVEYFLRKKHTKINRPADRPISTLFTYKTTRSLMRMTGDTGAYLRTVMGSLALFGSPPEDYWEYNIKKFEEEPTPFCYAFASNYQSLKYVRIDQPHMTTEAIITLLKRFLARKFPVMFGFTCFESLDKASDNKGVVPYPEPYEDIVGGHAITLCGYDDTTSLFLFKNSWGIEWGDNGYGYLPYKYFEERLADDCWTILNQEWIDNMPFEE